jgi:hypothetical protein
MAERPLLLHSLAEFRSILLPVLEAVKPSRLVELGGEGGQLSEELAAWAAGNGAELHCVEPLPSPTLEQLSTQGRLQLTRGKSPGALAGLPAFDLAVVDGDHNWHVVTGELESVFGEHGAQWPVAVLHDVAWPAARRDQYYDPADVPDEARQPYDGELGAVPGEAELQDLGGFRGEGAFAYALTEGGPRNGVLTAVEDFLAGRDDLELRRIPVIFGMGVVFPRDAPFAGELRALLDPLHEHDLLTRLERNRIDLLLNVIRMQDEMERHARGTTALLAGLERELEAEKADNARLRLALAERDANG